MALVINDRVKETSTTTGTGALTFAGAVSGFETFSAGIGNSNTTYYAVVNTDTPTEWEVGLGTLAGDSSTIRHFLFRLWQAINVVPLPPKKSPIIFPL